MKLLVVVSHLRRGGLVEVVYNLCQRLVNEKRVQLTVLSLRKEPADSRIEMFRALGIEVLSLNNSYFACELRSSLVRAQVQQIVNQYQIDVVHCHGYHPALVCAGLVGVKKMTTLHDRATEDFINAFGPFLGRYMLNRYFHALAGFDLNVAVSESGAELYRQFLDNVDFVNNGIDTEKFGLLADSERAVKRKHLHLPEDTTLFVTSGRVEREKRCEELVEFFAKKVQNKQVGLLVLGDGSRLESCRQIAKNCPNIIFTGRISNVVDYLQCADYYVSYSKSEGMSMAVCEAIACGLFPVLSDIPSHIDVAKPIGALLFKRIEDVGVNAVLSKRIDKNELHEYIDAHFSMVSMTHGYTNIYRRLCAE